jgi:large subunit ribosomal protein L4
MPKKMRQAALRSALSAKVAEAGLIVVDGLKLDELKTRVMATALSALAGKSTALIVMPAKDKSYDAVVQSTDNLADAKVLLANYLNIRDLLGFDKVILPVEAVDTLVAHLG